MTKTLDKSRPFGSVHPADDGQHYEQDGYPFDHEGKLCVHKLTKAQKEKLAIGKPVPPRPAQNGNAADTNKPALGEGGQTATPGQQTGGEGGEGNGGSTTTPAVVNDGQLNLEAWLKTGFASAPFRDVQNAVKERYQKWATKKEDLVDFLVNDQKLVPKAQCAADIQALLG